MLNMYKKVNWYYLAIFFITIIIFHFSYNLKTLNPTNIKWLMAAYHDWGTHYLGWAFYKDEPWTFPIGAIQNYNYPNGTNIGFTDSIPLMALLFKPLAFLLPDDFQYFGIWLFLCFFITGIYSFKIFELYKVKRYISIIAVVLIMANPVLIFRGFHPALCSQWLIVASIYFYLKNSNLQNAKSNNISQIIILILSALISPYFTAMIFGFNIILPLKNFFFDKSITLKDLIIYPVLSLFSVLIIWYIIGMIGIEESTNLASVERYNYFSFNLNSFFNSYGNYSKFFPDLQRTDPRQYEGFAYLGLGMMVIIISSLVYLILYKKNILIKAFKKYSLLVLLCCGLTLFAITNELTYGTETILKLPLPKIIETLGFVFRASGRFIWVMYYFIFIFSLLIFMKMRINVKIKLGLLVLFTSLQMYDIQELFTSRNLPSGSYTTKLSDEKWITVMKSFDDIIIYPPYSYNYSMTYPMDYQDVCFLALKAKKPISNGYVARTNIHDSEKFRTELTRKLNLGQIEDNRLFITTPDYIGDFDVLLKKNSVDIQYMNKFVFIYSNKKKLSTSHFENDIVSRKTIDSIKQYYKKHKSVEFKPVDFELKDESKIVANFDNFDFKENILQLRGWAFLKETSDNKGDTIFLSLTNNNRTVAIPFKVDKRPDITTFYKKKYLDDSGFYSAINTQSLDKKVYNIGIIIKNKTGSYFYIKTDKIIDIK